MIDPHNTPTQSAATSIRVGDAAPDFTRSDQQDRPVHLAAFRGRSAVVLFFYPKDDSPVCTAEACAFRDRYAVFTEAGAVVIGISPDSAASHQAFAARHRLPYSLLGDEDGSLRRLYGVPKALGLLPGRVTYVIDREGIVRHVFSAMLNADRHIVEALRTLRSLAG